MSADGRLASALGLCSAFVVRLEQRLQERTAPGQRAPGYKLRVRPGGGAYAKRFVGRGREEARPRSRQERVVLGKEL